MLKYVQMYASTVLVKDRANWKEVCEECGAMSLDMLLVQDLVLQPKISIGFHGFHQNQFNRHCYSKGI